MLDRINNWHLIAGLFVWAWVIVPSVCLIPRGSVFGFSYVFTVAFIFCGLISAMIAKNIDSL